MFAGLAGGLDALRLRVQDDLRWEVEIAEDSQTVDLGSTE